MRRWLRRLGGSSEGNALVELALALPVLVFVMFATIDFARIFYMSIQLSNAARAGAQYGAFNLGQSAQTTTMETVATTAINTTGVTATASRLCQCADDTGAFSATSPANDCSSPESSACPGGGHRVATVSVWTNKTFTTVTSIPGIPTTMSISRGATLRVSQ
jgi:Flp pilus assembly protein TadG